MTSLKLGENIEINAQLILKACSLIVEIHYKSLENVYILEKSRDSLDAIFSFPGYWSINYWYDGDSFGETKINLELFPSLEVQASMNMPRSTKPFCKEFFCQNLKWEAIRTTSLITSRNFLEEMCLALVFTYEAFHLRLKHISIPLVSNHLPVKSWSMTLSLQEKMFIATKKIVAITLESIVDARCCNKI